MNKFKVGDLVRVTDTALPTPYGTVFTVTGVEHLLDRHFGDYYYVGAGAEQGIWERYLVAEGQQIAEDLR